MSSARLAARYPQSGGTYVYGRERLGAFWGHTAGWSFVVGKTASCAAMALTVGYYVWPAQAPALAVASVVALTAFGYAGIQKSALLTRVIVALVLAVLAMVVVVRHGHRRTPGRRPALLRLRRLRAHHHPRRVGPRSRQNHSPRRPAGPGYRSGRVCAGGRRSARAIGQRRARRATAPLSDAVHRASFPALVPVVTVGAAVGALGGLLALPLGVSRTVLARHLPHALASIHPRHRTPHRAELAVGIAVALLAAIVDVRGAIGFSSFAVLLYYAIANTAAITVGGRVMPAIGLAGCLIPAGTLPVPAVLVGTTIVLIGMAIYAVQARHG